MRSCSHVSIQRTEHLVLVVKSGLQFRVLLLIRSEEKPSQSYLEDFLWGCVCINICAVKLSPATLQLFEGKG